MKIRITKETKDIRDNRNNVLKKGQELRVSNELGKEYIDKKLAVNVNDDPDFRVIKSVEDAKKFEQEQQEK